MDDSEVHVVAGFRRWGDLPFHTLPTTVGAGRRAATHAAHWAAKQQGRAWGQTDFRAQLNVIAAATLHRKCHLCGGHLAFPSARLSEKFPEKERRGRVAEILYQCAGMSTTTN